MDNVHRTWIVGATKIPWEQRDIAHAVDGGMDSRAFFDVIAADDDPAVPMGASVTYRVELTDAEAATFRAASNCRYVELDGTVTRADVTVADVGVGTAAAGPLQIPTVDTLGSMRAIYAESATWHGRDVNVAVLDEGTTAVVRDYMGFTLVARTVVGPIDPGAAEVNGPHGCFVAPNAVPRGGRLLDCIISNTEGSATYSAMAAGMRWAADNGAKVVNLSFGGPGETVQALKDGAQYLKDRNVLLFCSAGNNSTYTLGSTGGLSQFFSNAHSSIASDENTDARAAFSNYHEDGSGSAPGRLVTSLTIAAVPTAWSGTSASSPHMASLAARALTGGRFTTTQVGAALKASVRDTGQTAQQQGHGAYDLASTMRALGALPARTAGASMSVVDVRGDAGLSQSATYTRASTVAGGDLEALVLIVSPGAAVVVPDGWAQYRNQVDATHRVRVLTRTAQVAGTTPTPGPSPTPAPTGQTPGAILGIGTSAGRNHYSVQMSRLGDAAFFARTSAEISAGYQEPGYYEPNAAKNAVVMTAYVGGPTTGGSKYSRTEHREEDESGNKIAFNALDSGTHRQRVKFTVNHLMTHKPEIVLQQLHNGDADRVAIRTQLVQGVVELRIRINGTSATMDSTSPISPSAMALVSGVNNILNVEFDSMIEVINGRVKVYLARADGTLGNMTTPVLTSTALTSTGSSSWYFKTGCYLQSQKGVDGDADDDWGRVTQRGLSHFHTGWAPSIAATASDTVNALAEGTTTIALAAAGATETYLWSLSSIVLRSSGGPLDPSALISSIKLSTGTALDAIPVLPTRTNDYLINVFGLRQSAADSSLTTPDGLTFRSGKRWTGGTNGYTTLVTTKQLTTGDPTPASVSTASAAAAWAAVSLTVPSGTPSTTVTLPSSVLNLSRWALTLPVAAPSGPATTPWTVSQPDLAAFQSTPYFRVESGAVVCEAPTRGVTTSADSGATRTELREMLNSSGATAKASWGFGDGGRHTLTVTMSCDATSVAGRKEVIVGQIHDANNTPPIYLAINQNSLPGALNLFKNGPSDGALLTGLQAGTVFSYRLDVDPVAGKLNIYACVGDIAGLVLKKSYPLTDFAAQDVGCYFKAGTYNKEPISTATTGSAVTRMTRLDLVNTAPAAGATLGKPGAVLHIGPDPSPTVGWNHFNLGYTNGGPHTEKSQSELLTFEDKPWWGAVVDADGDPVVEASAPIGGGTTSGSSNPRTELRELKRNGTERAAWDPAQGDNWIEGIYRFVGLAPGKPECSAVQAHNADDDTLMILTKKRSSGTGQDLILKAMFPGDSNSAQVAVLLPDYQIGTKFYAKLRVNNGDLSVYFTTDLTTIPTIPVYVKASAFTSNPTWYFKTGAYVQANPTSDPSDSRTAALTRLQLQKVKVFHTGYPAQADYSITTPDPGPTPTTGIPWTKKFRDGTAYPTITGGDGGTAGIATSISALQSAVSNSVVTYTGSGLTGDCVLLAKSNVTFKALKLLPGATLTFKDCSNVRAQVDMRYQQAGDIVQVDGTFANIEFFDSVFGPDSEAAVSFTATCQYLAIGDSASAGSSMTKLTRCTFQNKSSAGNAYRQYGNTGSATGGTRYSVASQCVWRNIRPFDENDHEAIRLGVSSLQQTNGHHVVEFCRFENCQGEPEVISMKMNWATVRGCTFVDCVGGPSLRHGDDGEISDCWMVGDAAVTGTASTTVRTSAGVRGYGKRHNIHHNTIRVNGTSNYERPILLDYGDTAPSTTSNGHAYVQDWTVTSNLLVKCGDGIVVGKNYSTAPSGCTVSDNWLVECAQVDSSGVRPHNGASLSGVTVSGNQIYATTSIAGLTQGDSGEWLAPASAGKGARTPFVAAAMAGKGSTWDPWGLGTYTPNPNPNPSPTPDPTPNPNPTPTPNPNPNPTPTPVPNPTPPAPVGSVYSTVSPFFVGSQLTSPEMRYGLAAAFARSSTPGIDAEGGVLPGGGQSAFTPSLIEAGSTPRVSIAPGQAVVSRPSGTYVCTLATTAIVSLPIPLPVSGQSRIDLLVGEVVDPEADSGIAAGSVFRLRVIPGVPASVPGVPVGPVGSVPMWQWRVGNDGSITAVTSRRQWTRSAGGVRPVDAGDTRPGAYPGDLRVFPTGQIDAWISGAWQTVVAPSVWTEADVPWRYAGGGAAAAGPCSFGADGTSKVRYKRAGNDLTFAYTINWGNRPYNMGVGQINTVLPNGWTTPPGRDQWVPCHIWVKDVNSFDVQGMALVLGGSNIMSPFFPFDGPIYPYKVADAIGVPGRSVPLQPYGFAEGGSLHIGGLMELRS